MRRRSCFNVLHFATGYKVDIFVRGDSDYDRVSLQRSVARPLDEGTDPRLFPIATPEDILLRKLQWYRSGGEASERQWRDVIGVLRVQRGGLDVEYLRRWATVLGVDDLLQGAQRDAAD